MKNAEFELLTVEERKAFFESLTPEDVDGLTKDQKAAYDEFLNSSTDNQNESVLDRLAAKYFKENPGVLYKSLMVVSDGTIFYPTIKGKNNCDNYLADNKHRGLYAAEISKK